MPDRLAVVFRGLKRPASDGVGMARIFRPEELDEIYGDVDVESVQEQVDELKVLHREVEKSDGAAVLRLQRDLQRIHYIVNANYSDLMAAIDRFETEKGLIAADRIEELDEVLMEITRHLHNYIGSTVARYDQTEKRAIEKLDALCDCEPGIDDAYTDKKNEELGNQPAFFTGLRNFSYHRRLLVPAGREQSSPPETTWTRELYFQKDVLFESDWSSAAQSYLSQLDDEINLRAELEDYHTSLDTLHEWLFEKINDCCDDELEHHDALLSEIKTKQDELIHR
jgi:hypothetical protein